MDETNTIKGVENLKTCRLKFYIERQKDYKTFEIRSIPQNETKIEI